MKLGYELTIKQKQQLTMTPEMVQALRILQFNTFELFQYANRELVENPVLEEAEPLQDPGEVAVPLEIGDQIAEDDYDDRRDRLWVSEARDRRPPIENYPAVQETLQEHLLEQLNLMEVTAEQGEICRYLIASLDDNGYLFASTEEVCALFDCGEKDYRKALDRIWEMDPYGVGARNLAECLEIQLTAQGMMDHRLRIILREMLPLVAENKVKLIAKTLGISVPEAQVCMDRIRALEPKPGRMYASAGEKLQYVIPEINVEKAGEEYVVSSNDSSVPRLRVSAYYKDLSEQARQEPELSEYLTGRLNSAMWLIKSIEQRKQTIFQVASGIIRHQQEFLEKGERYIRKLTLKKLADEVGVHESTVSRAINGKYIQTPRGVFEMKYFFTSGVPAGDEAEALSANSVKVLIRDIIGQEDPGKPCSDQAIAERLQQQDVRISRRTVAKYREAMGIPSSSGRRRW